ncbi:PP2C family protein-serine/threonine phosphatase [Paenibacillus tarimensis]|uniref:PP2C family protein-serine/threonine phosphatase n=1 Tax=Paenibacillus tarimensis TaxID=416012 RepID=UPI001F39FB31|nr:fused response regulator/phosphatase [Paenibacillus tarimensis]MCF2942753.1 fused response regulator/phosphatase [Paenibacillus tarimensis]
MSILIVDDSSFNLAYIRDVLINAGYNNIKTANSAHEAFGILGIEDDSAPRRPAAIDLILLDILMPEMDGIEACKRIKEYAIYSDLPIIFLTGSTDLLKEAFNAGGMDFIERGSPQYELLARVNSAIRLKREMDIRKNRENRMHKELRLAKHLQKSVLSSPIAEPGIQVNGKYIQSDEVSGDMFYWTRIDQNRYGVLLIDVSGHGLSSALISMSVRSMLEEIVCRLVEPDLVCAELNKQILHLFKNSKHTVYFTAIYLLIDNADNKVHFFNAGHPPAIVLEGDDQSFYLKGTTIPIGVKKEINSTKKTFTIKKPAKIVLYTDGLVETPGLSIKKGIEHLRAYVSKVRSLPNDDFLLEIEKLAQNNADDVCIISIELT